MASNRAIYNNNNNNNNPICKAPECQKTSVALDFLMTLSDLECHSSVACQFKCDFSVQHEMREVEIRES